MITHPDELERDRLSAAMRHLSAKDFEKMQKSQNEAFIKFFHSIATYIDRIFKRRSA